MVGVYNFLEKIIWNLPPPLFNSMAKFCQSSIYDSKFKIMQQLSKCINIHKFKLVWIFITLKNMDTIHSSQHNKF